MLQDPAGRPRSCHALRGPAVRDREIACEGRGSGTGTAGGRAPNAQGRRAPNRRRRRRGGGRRGGAGDCGASTADDASDCSSTTRKAKKARENEGPKDPAQIALEKALAWVPGRKDQPPPPWDKNALRYAQKDMVSINQSKGVVDSYTPSAQAQHRRENKEKLKADTKKCQEARQAQIDDKALRTRADMDRKETKVAQLKAAKAEKQQELNDARVARLRYAGLTQAEIKALREHAGPKTNANRSQSIATTDGEASPADVDADAHADAEDVPTTLNSPADDAPAGDLDEAGMKPPLKPATPSQIAKPRPVSRGAQSATSSSTSAAPSPGTAASSSAEDENLPEYDAYDAPISADEAKENCAKLWGGLIYAGQLLTLVKKCRGMAKLRDELMADPADDGKSGSGKKGGGGMPLAIPLHALAKLHMDTEAAREEEERLAAESGNGRGLVLETLGGAALAKKTSPAIEKAKMEIAKAKFRNILVVSKFRVMLRKRRARVVYDMLQHWSDGGRTLMVFKQ